MKKRQIVNIINFIRGVEPRVKIDLEGCVREQIALMKKHNFRGTFLLQYDALIMDEYVTMLKELDPAQFELGVWFETVQPQVEKAGLKWTGRYSWDWHVHCGFPMGYTAEDREKLVDVLYEQFKETFGYYPRVFGSWFFDSHTVRYISEKYGVDALCNCKEQYGTDGYTLWGGYYGQGYYPSKTNIFMPAQNEEEQIPVPVFRMLGSDPVYQYDFGASADDDTSKVQGVITLEPAYTTAGGGVPSWVDWYLKENYNGDCLSFGYAQAGQENSFGWPAMKDGLIYQFAQMEKLLNEGKIEIETLGETGRWFKETYSSTPASAITAHTAYDDPEISSVWYCTKNYRINLYGDHGKMHIRDLHIFHEKFPDPFEDTVCPDNEAAYETLPVVDGNRHSGNGIWAGGYITYADGSEPSFDKMAFTDLGEGKARVEYGGLIFDLYEDGFTVTGEQPFTLENRIGTHNDHMMNVEKLTETSISLSYQGFGYGLEVSGGRFVRAEAIVSDGNSLEIRVNNK